MATLREIKRRIVGVKSTQQITKAMKMVSASKLRKAQKAVLDVRPYTRKMEDIIMHLSKDDSDHPLLTAHKEIKNTLYLVIGSDRGFCGGFNGNLQRFLDQTLAKENHPYQLVVLGRRLSTFCSRTGKPVALNYTQIGDNPNYSQARELSAYLTKSFLSGEFDEVYVIYSKFISSMSQIPTVKKLLPLSYEKQHDEPKAISLAERVYILEPDGATILNTILPQYLDISVYCALQEAKASEHGARMTAMNSATNNATDMINNLTIALNRARQAAITKEISEIVGGAAALNQ